MTHVARKRFGQHFLHDPGTIRRIVAAIAPGRSDHLVEIGPGLGAITGPLLERAGRVEVVELDRDLAAELPAHCTGLGELVVHNADALRFDFCALAGPGEQLRVVGNLPYNISTPLVFHLLAQRRCIADMHFMLQREVVDRMAATAGSKDYGRLTVMLAVYAEVEPLFRIGSGAFRPPPKVTSAFVRITPYREPRFSIDDPERLAALVRQAFSLRRKTLRNALTGFATAEELEALNIDPRRRPETLDAATFVRIANECRAN